MKVSIWLFEKTNPSWAGSYGRSSEELAQNGAALSGEELLRRMAAVSRGPLRLSFPMHFEEAGGTVVILEVG